MDEESNPLNDLYITDDSYDQQRLVNVLNNFIGINQDASVVSKPAFEDLNDAQKVVCYLLSRRTLYDLDEIAESDIPQKPIDIANWTNMTEYDAGNICDDLSLIKGTSDDYGPYIIPITYIETAISVVEGSIDVEVEKESRIPTFDETDFLEESNFNLDG